MQGGKFGHGFLSAGLSKLATPTISANVKGDLAQGISIAIVGGTISEATGGKFANGAVTAAMAFAFNQVASDRAQERQAAKSAGEGMVGPYHSAFDPASGDYHDYDVGPSVVCALSTVGCSQPMMSPIVGSESIPFTIFYSGPGSYGLPYGLGWDPIIHLTPRQGIWWNITEPEHRYHPGVVVHALYESGNKLWLYTKGVGVGPDAAWNVAVGEVLFKDMHVDVQRRVLQQLHGGPPRWVP